LVGGTLNLLPHPRPARRGAGVPAADLAPLDLDGPQLGIAVIGDFAWNRLVSFDACIQCGRCEAACPAYAAGQPLNPKALIQDFVAALPGPALEHYSGSPHPPRVAESGGTIIRLGADSRGAVHSDTIWACTTCRACVYECPMMIEHVDAIVDLRRHQTLERGATPGKGAEALAELKAADNPGGRALSSRLDWASDLDLPVFAKVKSAENLLWLGEGAFDLRNQRSLRALVRLLRRAGVDFAVLGAEELDSGDIARRLGDEAVFQELARRNIATLAKYRFSRIITADPHVLHCLKNEYPALGGRYDVIHHSTLLAGLLAEGKLEPQKALGGSVTYHDPCYLGRYNGEIASPRAILDRLGLGRREMERAGMRSSCCGGGGGAPLSDIAGTGFPTSMDHLVARLFNGPPGQLKVGITPIIEPPPPRRRLAGGGFGALILADLPSGTVEVAYDRCGRHGRYSKRDLAAMVHLAMLRHSVTIGAECAPSDEQKGIPCATKLGWACCR
jgi:Fe-S oxidoreductase